jgi:hypothetical protein
MAVPWSKLRDSTLKKFMDSDPPTSVSVYQRSSQYNIGPWSRFVRVKIKTKAREENNSRPMRLTGNGPQGHRGDALHITKYVTKVGDG